ncbi:DUF5684 domain-containing protein [Megalodesulfovibrio paquesii]
MRILLVTCCLVVILAPAVSVAPVGSLVPWDASTQTAQAAQGLHMWEGRDGSVTIRDTRPEELQAIPNQYAAPRNATLAGGLNGTLNGNATEEPHPLRLMQEGQQELATTLLSNGTNASEYEQEAEAFLQLMRQHPEFNQEWEKMPEEERQAMLRNMGAMSQQMPMDLGLFTTLMQFMWILQLLGVLSYILWALCMGRISAPLGVGSFAQYLIPFWNLYLLVKAAGMSGWALLLFLVPLVNLGFMFHVYGRIAARLGKDYLLWAIGLVVGSCFMSLLVGLYPFFRLAQHARAMQQAAPNQATFGNVL